MCGPEDPLFTPLLPLARVPFQAKESVHKTPFWENFEILASTASIFTQILAHKPQVWKFSAHKPPNLEIFRSQAPLFRGKCQFASPTLRKSGPHTPTWKKKLSAPPPDVGLQINFVYIAVAYILLCKLNYGYVTITRHVFINIFQTEHFSAVKFAMGYEKNMSFLVIGKSPKVWKKKLKR